MPNDFDLKFINFLKKHDLYDEKVLKYIAEQSVDIDIDSHDFLLGSCHTVINNNNGKLEQIIPCMPNIMDDYSVMIAIYTYVNTLLLLPKLNKTYDNELFYNYFLPLFYKKIYILENPSDELLMYEKTMRERLLKFSPNNFKYIFELIDSLTCNYNKNSYDSRKIAKKAKRLARTYMK